MPYAPEVQQLVRQVEEASARPVHVAEEPGMKMRATVTPAHGEDIKVERPETAGRPRR